MHPCQYNTKLDSTCKRVISFRSNNHYILVVNYTYDRVTAGWQRLEALRMGLSNIVPHRDLLQKMPIPPDSLP